MNCHTCSSPIADLRKETRCSSCSKPLHTSCAIKDDGIYCDNCYMSLSFDKAKQYTLPDVIRRSHIELYKRCPYAFYLDVVKGVPQTSGVHAQIGIDLHVLFQKYNEVSSYTLAQMTEEFDAVWNGYGDKLFDSSEQKDDLRARATNSIKNFFIFVETMPREAFASEQTLTFPIAEGLPNVQITMDRINLIDGELEMVDWKTGKVMVGQKFSTDLQAPLYIHAVKTHFHLPVRSFTLYYVNEEKIRTFNRVNDDEYVCSVKNKSYTISLTEAIREVNSIFSRIKNEEFNIPRDTKSMYFTCKMCSYLKSGHCSGAENMSWSLINERRS